MDTIIVIIIIIRHLLPEFGKYRNKIALQNWMPTLKWDEENEWNREGKGREKKNEQYYCDLHKQIE
jgi:hypothetical protein